MSRSSVALALPFALVASLGPAGCRLVEQAEAATRSTSPFRQSPVDPRVAYEPGAEEMAAVVAAALPLAVETVEQQQYAPFRAPVHVYVCATLETFTLYGAAPRAAGHTINHRVFISPKPENTSERVPRILTHELSHLHLGEKDSLLNGKRLPTWFVEGLAVMVSGGGGAEGVTDEDASRAILEGHTFVPETEGSLLHGQGANRYGLDTHLFYREAGMFVAFLRSEDERAFHALIGAVEDGDALAPAIDHAYGTSVASLWGRFRGSRLRPM